MGCGASVDTKIHQNGNKQAVITPIQELSPSLQQQKQPSTSKNQNIPEKKTQIKNQIVPNKPESSEKPQQPIIKKSDSSYNIPQLQTIIAKAFGDLTGSDPMGKRLYMNQILHFILDWLPKQMARGRTLFDAEKIVRHDLQLACKDYPIAEIVPIKTTVQKLIRQPLPNLYSDVKNKTKETFTDRIKQICQRSKEVSYEFNKEMQIILEKDGGYKFIAGYKFTGTKAYLRIMTKILEPFLSSQLQSKQVYTDLNHYYYVPVFQYFNKLLDQNINKVQIQLYDWIRCKCSFKNIDDLERAFFRLKDIYGKDIFRIKNRINQNARDLFINLKYKTQYTEIQLALVYDDSTYEFQHKLYELTRQKLGIAYSCFTFMLSEGEQSHGSSAGIMTSLGYLKKTLLREKVEPNFERLTYQDAQFILNDVSGLVGKKSIVALKTGYVNGADSNSILKKEPYGPDIDVMLVIKKKKTDPVYNWLNWFS